MLTRSSDALECWQSATFLGKGSFPDLLTSHLVCEQLVISAVFEAQDARHLLRFPTSTYHIPREGVVEAVTLLLTWQRRQNNRDMGALLNVRCLSLASSSASDIPDATTTVPLM